MVVRVQRTVGGTSVAIPSERYEAKRLGKSLQRRVPAYKKRLAAYRTKKEQYKKKKAEYLAKKKKWEAKYSQYTTKKGGKVVFAPRRKISTRVIRAKFKEYQAEGATLQKEQTGLVLQQKSLVQEQQALQTEATSLQEQVGKYEQVSKKAGMTVVKQTTKDGYTVTEAGVFIRHASGFGPRDIAPPPKEITTKEPTWTRGYVGKAIHFKKKGYEKIFTPPAEKYVKISGEMAKFEEKTSRLMPVERAKRISGAVKTVSLQKFEIAKDVYPYAFPGAKRVLENPRVSSALSKGRAIEGAMVYTAVRELFKHPIKYASIATVSAATAGAGTGAAVGLGSKLFTSAAIGGYIGYKSVKFESAYKQKGLVGIGEELGVILAEVGAVGVGFGITKTIKAATGYTTYKVEGIKNVALKKIEGTMHVTAQAKGKPFHPLRIVNRWGKTVDVRIDSPVKYYSSGDETRAASADYFTALAKQQYFKGKFISITQPYSQGTDLFRSDYISKVKVDDKVITSVGKEMSIKTGSRTFTGDGKEFKVTEFIGAGVGKDVGSKAITGRAGTFTLTEVTASKDLSGTAGANFIKYATQTTQKTTPVIIPKGVVSDITKTITAAVTKPAIVSKPDIITPLAFAGTTKQVSGRKQIVRTITIQDVTQQQKDLQKQEDKIIQDTLQKTKQRQRTKARAGISTAQITGLAQDQGQVVAPIQAITQTQAQQQQQRLLTGPGFSFSFGFGTSVPPPPPPGWGWGMLGWPGLLRGRPGKWRRKRGKKYKRRYRYQPSLVGLQLPPVRMKVPKKLTGLEIRPIILGPKRKRRRKKKR